MSSKNSKQGLIKTLVLIIIGVFLLSYLGFDLRAQVSEFEENNQNSISFVKQTLFNVIIPKTEESFDVIKNFAKENDLTIETATRVIEIIKKYANEIDFESYGVTVPEFKESSTNTASSSEI